MQGLKKWKIARETERGESSIVRMRVGEKKTLNRFNGTVVKAMLKRGVCVGTSQAAIVTSTTIGDTQAE